MKVPSRTASRARHIICPLCESGELVTLGEGFARCGSCGLPLVGSALETLGDIVGLRLGGPSRGKSQARDDRYLMVGYFAPGPVLRRRWNRQDAPPPRAAGSGGRSYVTGSLRRMGISTQRLRGATR
jgi:hypothetical protein